MNANPFADVAAIEEACTPRRFDPPRILAFFSKIKNTLRARLAEQPPKPLTASDELAEPLLKVLHGLGHHLGNVKDDAGVFRQLHFLRDARGDLALVLFLRDFEKEKHDQD